MTVESEEGKKEDVAEKNWEVRKQMARDEMVGYKEKRRDEAG